MTDGRFDSSFNMRPGGWDSRRHWTKTHAPFATDPEHIRDHMERESCPFHDLRADGCFQPEQHDHGPDFGTKRPEELMRRKDGNPMTTGAGVRQHRGRGMGGLPIPEDVEPAGVAAPPPAAGGHGPWKSGGGKLGAFSTPGYVPAAPLAPVRGEAPKAFHTGKGIPAIGAPVKHHPEPYKDPKPYGRPTFRLGAGLAKRKDVIGPAPPCPPMEKKPKRSATAPRPVFTANKSITGAFSHVQPHIPDPVPQPKLKTGKWALFTYAAKTKRCMTVEVPWKAGTTAAEAPRPPADVVANLNRTTGNVTMRGKPQLGQVNLLQIK